jgi:dihydroorotate dehydrogenase electron transfer subunit
MALEQNLEVVLVCDSTFQGLPEAVEVQPLQALNEVCKWADTIAFDESRENLNQLKEMLGGLGRVAAVHDAQILIHTPMPCGGLAECGVCAVASQRAWKLACRDGPVFLLKDAIQL